jgi:hypothetical protein
MAKAGAWRSDRVERGPSRAESRQPGTLDPLGAGGRVAALLERGGLSLCCTPPPNRTNFLLGI